MKTNRNISGIISIASLAGVVMLYIMSFSTGREKIAYVDSAKLLANYKGMQQAKGVFEKKVKQWQGNVDTLAAEFDRKLRQYEKEKSSMTPKETALAEENLKTREREYYRYREAIAKQKQEEEMKMTQEVLAAINGRIKDFGKREGYRIIIGATHMGNLVYAEDGLDITDEVLKELNEK